MGKAKGMAFCLGFDPGRGCRGGKVVSKQVKPFPAPHISLDKGLLLDFFLSSRSWITPGLQENSEISSSGEEKFLCFPHRVLPVLGDLEEKGKRPKSRDKIPFFLCPALENSFLCYARRKFLTENCSFLMENKFGVSYRCRILELGGNHSGSASGTAPTFPSFHDCSAGIFPVLFPVPKPFLVQQEKPKPGIEPEVTNFREKPAPKVLPKLWISWNPVGFLQLEGNSSQRAKEKLPMDTPRWKMQQFGSFFNLKIKF